MMGMTNEQLIEFNQNVITEFREHDGVMPEDSVLHGNPTLLITMTGAKSGRQLTSPLSFASDGSEWIVMASAGGSEKTPNWTYNLRTEPNVTIELRGETFAAFATETEGEDRTRAFETLTAQLPRFADYQQQVERQIPLFRLRRL